MNRANLSVAPSSIFTHFGMTKSSASIVIVL
jgi:hypothetical protein